MMVTCPMCDLTVAAKPNEKNTQAKIQPHERWAGSRFVDCTGGKCSVPIGGDHG